MTVPAYCTNVHAGATLSAMLEGLSTHATAVRGHLVRTGDLAEDEHLPLGAWLAAPVVFELRAGGADRLRRLDEWLRERRLAIGTINGFPFGDFHGPRVKHAVYHPGWTTVERLEYTKALVDAGAILARGASGPLSISTLPLGWPTGEFGHANPDAALAQSARHLLEVVEHAQRVEDQTGALVRLDLEPEPGCVLQRAGDVAAFATGHLGPEARRRGLSEERLRRHLGVCLDTCHLAVMFEEVDPFVRQVHDAGLAIGKIQISSAPRCDFATAPPESAVQALRSLVEPRYLHQTMVRGDDGSLRFSEDLPEALAWITPQRGPSGEWRVHFHVPIFLERLGTSGDPSDQGLATTSHLIEPALRAAMADRPVIEVETYAWNVLPGTWSGTSSSGVLAEGIAEELRWAQRILERVHAGSAGAVPR